MKLFFITIAFSSLFFLCACSTKKNLKAPLVTNTETEMKEQYPQAEIGPFSKKNDSFKIIHATIRGNFMEIEVSYSGGCDMHEFRLIGNQSLSKSVPPLRNIQLVHNAKNDACKKLITEKVTFSISNLAENTTPGNKVKLQLENYKEPLEYSYE